MMVGRDVFNAFASALFDSPSAAPSTIRARNAIRCSVLPERTIRFSTVRSSGVTTKAALLSHMQRIVTYPNHIVKLCARRYTRLLPGTIFRRNPSPLFGGGEPSHIGALETLSWTMKFLKKL